MHGCFVDMHECFLYPNVRNNEQFVFNELHNSIQNPKFAI